MLIIALDPLANTAILTLPGTVSWMVLRLCKCVFQNAISNATSLAEVERLKGMLQAGQIPGRDLRQGGFQPAAVLCASTDRLGQEDVWRFWRGRIVPCTVAERSIWANNLLPKTTNQVCPGLVALVSRTLSLKQHGIIFSFQNEVLLLNTPLKS